MISQHAQAAETDARGDVTPPFDSIESRFGVVHYEPDRIINLPKGLLGFVDYRAFVLTELPDREPSRFKLLQCVNDASLSLIVMPLLAGDDVIDVADREEACDILGVPQGDAAFLLIVTVRHTAELVQFSVNARAPLVIDTRRLTGYQHVLSNNKYDIRHPLN
ncbi:MAG: flagellar assembly protein FliW [Alphaproteobacteria bacterium]|nr:flagellar assembly protein FliW [Alphaproteobacteria bacterium]